MALTASLTSCVGTPSRISDAQRAATIDISAIAAADPGSRLPAGWQHGTFMEIFVRAWRDRGGPAQLDRFEGFLSGISAG